MFVPRPRLIPILAGALGATVALANAGAAPPTHQIVQLAAPPGAVSVAARAISPAGVVAGQMEDAAGNLHPVTWTNAVPTVLPLPSGFPGAEATGVSDSGVVCGTAWTLGSFGFSAAVKWDHGSPILIPTLGGQYSAANGLNTAGVIVGWTSTYGQAGGLRAFRYGTTLSSAGLLPDGGCSWTIGNAVNALGQIVGTALNDTNFNHAMLDDPDEGMMDLGTLGGLTSEALAISSAGHVVGWSQTGVRDAATFDGILTHAFLWRRGMMTDLGVLPDRLESRAMGVNASGVVVGRSTSPAPAIGAHAFAWVGGAMVDLNSAIPTGTGWTLHNAWAISDAGRIVAGQLNGQARAFLLIPIP